MIVVIQCAAGKQLHAGHLRALDGRDVMFVARPDAAPSGGDQVYARPDDIAESSKSWRTLLQEYNAAPGHNPLRLLQAWQLYKNPTYKILADLCGKDRLYILSAGWGLIGADFLTPNYDITFRKAKNVEPFQTQRSSRNIRRFHAAVWYCGIHRVLRWSRLYPFVLQGNRKYEKPIGPSSTPGVESTRRAAHFGGLGIRSQTGNISVLGPSSKGNSKIEVTR